MCPIKGVYIANPGYVFGAAGIPRAALISSFNGKKVDNLADFAAALSELADGARAPVRYVTIEDPRAAQLKVIRMDRRWFPARECKRDDTLGTWPCISIAPGPAPSVVKPASTQFAKTGDARIDRLAPSLVLVNFDMPYSISGVTEKNYHGTGVIVDAQRGLVAIDRNTVPVAMGDVRITFAGTVEVPGKVVFIHPLHNLAVISYDPKSIGNTPVRAATLVTRPLSPGDDVWVVGQRADSKIQSQKTQISSVDVVSFPLSRTLRFRDSNLEVVSLINPPSDYDGVLTDEKGDVLAMWSSFAFESQRELEQINRGIPSDLVSEMIGVVADGRPLYSFEAEFDVQSLAGARELGLPDEWVRRFEEHNPQRRQVLGINRLVAGSPAAALLEPGDLLAGDRRQGRESISRGGARGAEPRGLRDGVARWRRKNPADEDRGVEWPRHRSGAHLGRRDAAGAASRHGGTTRYCSLRRIRLVFLLWIAGDALRTVCRPTHHRSGWSADARSRCLHQGGERQARSRLVAAEDDQLEWPDGRDYVEARQALLAGIRTQSAGGWQLG